MSGDPEPVKRAPDPMALTEGSLLGGRIAYRQYRGFHRTGLEPVLLAAAVPAKPGQRVLEAGCGAAAGLLCIGARVPRIVGVGIEQDADMARLGCANLAANSHDWPIVPVPLQALSRQAHHGLAAPFHHAFANPPWHRANASRSPDPKRDLARRAPSDMLADWSGTLGAHLRPGGTLTLALPASLHAQAAAALLGSGFGTIRLLPLWPRQGRPARIVLIQGVRGGRGDSVLLPGLVLHGESGFTAEADAILRSGSALPMR